MSKLSKRLDELNIIYGAMNDSSMFNLFGNPLEDPSIIGVGSTGCTGCFGCMGFTGPSGYYIPSRGTTGCTGAQPGCTDGCTGYFIYATPPPPAPTPAPAPAPPVPPKKNFLTSPLFLGLTIGGAVLVLIIIIIVILLFSRKKPQQPSI